MAWTFEATEAGYSNLWKTAKLKGGQDGVNATAFADKIIAAESRYRAVQKATGVPWFFIGALHMRESSCNFAGVLHNGERIIGTGRVTTLEPAGRGPFGTWEEAAEDALRLKDMHRVQAWSPARMLYQAEVFNGLGYVGKGINSPYVWAGTTHEQRGKYVADRVFDPNADDVQLGVAAVLIRLADKRRDIALDLFPATTVEPKPMPDPSSPSADGELLSAVKTLNSNIVALMATLRSLTQTMSPEPAAPAPAPASVAPAPVPQPPATTTILDRPGVGTGVLGMVATAILQVLGVVGAPAGETATTTGQLLPLISAGTAALGATGTIGTVLNAIGAVIGVISRVRQQK